MDLYFESATSVGVARQSGKVLGKTLCPAKATSIPDAATPKLLLHSDTDSSECSLPYLNRPNTASSVHPVHSVSITFCNRLLPSPFSNLTVSSRGNRGPNLHNEDADV